MMGEIAEQYADHIILTDDNPRNEAGEEITQHILSGMSEPAKCLVIRDRASAIEAAVSQWRPAMWYWLQVKDMRPIRKVKSPLSSATKSAAHRSAGANRGRRRRNA